MSKQSPLGQTMIAIMNSPICDICCGSGLTDDELAECDQCCGYGRGKGLMKQMIDRVTDDVRLKRESEPVKPSFKIDDYR